MKIQYAIAASLLLSVGAFAQKDELKALKKLTDKQQPAPADVQEMANLLSQVEPKMSAATPEQQVDYNYYKGMYGVAQLMASSNKSQAVFESTLESFNKVIELEKNGKKKYTSTIQQQIFPSMKNVALKGAQELSKAKMFKEAALYYAAAYRLDTKDGFNLYNAAASSINAQDYDRALEYYLELEKTGFTGETTTYLAKDKATGQVQAFPDKNTRDIAVKTGQYDTPSVEKTPSVRADIVRNIALIYDNKGESEKAKEAFVNARKANPDDITLIISEANLYYKANNMTKYKELISEAIAKNPNDADLYFNLGVTTTDTSAEEAAKYFTKALEIKPDHLQANMAMGSLMLKDDQKIVNQMNSLGTSAADNKKYDALKMQRTASFNKALPYFEKAHKIDPSNQEVISMLASIYQALERTNDYKAMKAKLKS
ncbi:tetratricopeptide repeat protein [Flavobacterium suzhouense]|uniref:Tetratricopeptide repeat protein n=1 Tax=Flavobacterium suzhouense TaxID=1529638 RepID=A0ABW5NX18_9FLAO